MGTARARSHTLPISLGFLLALLLIGFAPISPTWQYVVAVAMGWAIAAVGLDVFFGYLGQGSFGQAAFVAFGAYVATILRGQFNVDSILSVAAALVLTGLLALLFGVVMVQLAHFGFVVSTFFFSFVMYAALTGQQLAFLTKSENGLRVPSMIVGGVDIGKGSALYFMSWAALLIVVVLSSNLVDGRWGRSARLIKRSELVAAVLGVRVKRVKIAGFVYAGILAGLAGFLISLGVGYLAPESFDPGQNVLLFGMAVLGGLGSITGPILGAFFFTLVPQIIVGAGAANAVIFGIALIVVLVFLPEGLFGVLERLKLIRTESAARLWRAFLARLRVPSAGNPRVLATASVAPANAAIPSQPIATVAGAGSGSAQSGRLVAGQREIGDTMIAVQNVTVRFSGIVALNGVNLSVRQRSTHAVIGPNGAGKTTLLNCLTGIQRCEQGEIKVGQAVATHMSPAEIRRLGVARTFQNPSLVGDLTTIENVKLGLHTVYRWGMFEDMAGPIRTGDRERVVEAKVCETLELLRIPTARWHVLASQLTLAEQKLADLARAVVAGAGVVLLDEPTSGLSDRDVTEVARVLLRLRDTTDLTMVVISHSVSFVAHVADLVTVLNFGQVLGEGTPSAVAADPVIARAFIGTRPVSARA